MFVDDDVRSDHWLGLPGGCSSSGINAFKISAFLRVLYGSIFVLAVVLMPGCAPAPDNYEIQVYCAETVEPGSTRVELHTNFTAQGNKGAQDGLAPTNHAWHETPTITPY